MTLQKVSYSFLLLAFLAHFACVGSLEVPVINNPINLEACPFYGVVNDSLWCGTILEAIDRKDIAQVELHMEKEEKLINGFPEEEISFIIESFVGVGQYELKNEQARIFQRKDANSFNYTYLLSTEKGDIGDVEITSFEESSGKIRGAISFSASDGELKKRLTGGRFEAVLE